MPFKEEAYIRHQLNDNYMTDTEGTDAPSFTHSFSCVHSGPMTCKSTLWPEYESGVPCGARFRAPEAQTHGPAPAGLRIPSPETSHFQVGPGTETETFS